MHNLRKFIIVEGLSSNTGRICQLKKIVEIAKATKCRIILDESNSLGLISFKGGLAKYFDVSPSDIDIIIGSFTNSLGSVGGYSAGSFFVTDHQVIWTLFLEVIQPSLLFLSIYARIFVQYF